MSAQRLALNVGTRTFSTWISVLRAASTRSTLEVASCHVLPEHFGDRIFVHFGILILTAILGILRV